MKDEALESYVVELERHLTRRRGSPQTLSPRDFALARGWFEAGVPLGAVLDGVERALEKDPGASSLAFCRSFVEAAAARAAPARARPAAATQPVTEPTLPGGELREAVAALVAALDRIGAPESFDRPWRSLREVDELLRVAPRPNWTYLRERVAEADQQISQAVLDELPAEDRQTFEKEAEAARSRQRGRVEGGALALSARRYLIRRARERRGLPPPLALD